MAAVTEGELNEIAALLAAARMLEKLSVDAVKFHDSNGEYVGQIKYDTHNGYMFLMPGDPDEENVNDEDR